MDHDHDIDISEIAVYDWRNGGVPISVNTARRYASPAEPVPHRSSSYETERVQDFGSVSTSYTDQRYASSYHHSSSGYSNGSTSHYHYNYNHYQPNYTANSRDPRINATIPESMPDKNYGWLDFENIEEIDYSSKSTSTPSVNSTGIDYSSKSILDDVEEIDYSETPLPSLNNIEGTGCSTKVVPSPPHLTANGVEITKSPIVTTALVVPESDLALSDIITDVGKPNSINRTGLKQSSSSGLKRKREGDRSSSHTREVNDLVDLLGKSNCRVSSRLYAKPTRRVDVGSRTNETITPQLTLATDRISKDDGPSSTSSSFVNVAVKDTIERFNIDTDICNKETEAAVCEEDIFPVLRIRNDIFENDDDEDE
ncbi:unnamed protein product [Orchesella dallaii]